MQPLRQLLAKTNAGKTMFERDELRGPPYWAHNVLPVFGTFVVYSVVVKAD